MKPIYLLCGVPGSGKTWIARQLTEKFDWVPHDDFEVDQYWKALIRAAKHISSRSNEGKPVLGEAPFRISILIEQLRGNGAEVKPYFILEDEKVIRTRYETRERNNPRLEKRKIPAQHLRRIPVVRERAHFMGIASGTSDQILKILGDLELKKD